MSISINPPHTDAHETNPSRNFATILGSPAAVRSDFGSFFVGRLARRRSDGRPPLDRAGGPPPPRLPPPRRVSPRAPPLVRRPGRYGGGPPRASGGRGGPARGHRAAPPPP